MLRVQQFQQVRHLEFSINNNNAGERILTIYENNPALIKSTYRTDGSERLVVNGFLKNLRIYAQIESLDEIPLPDIQLTDTQAEMTQKALNIEWQSPRKQLSVFVGKSPSSWQQLGSISLLNPSGYPYRQYNLLDLFTDNLAAEIGEYGRIGIKLEDVGTGLLGLDDTISLYGSLTEEIFIISDALYTNSELPPINITIPTLAAPPITIVQSGGGTLNLTEIHGRGPTNERPNPSDANRNYYYFDEELRILYQSTGFQWIEVADVTNTRLNSYRDFEGIGLIERDASGYLSAIPRDSLYPKHFIEPWGFQKIVAGGTFSRTPSASYLLGTLCRQSPDALNDEVQISTHLAQGTYIFEMIGVTQPTGGINTILLDGYEIGSFDWYSSATVNNVTKSFSFTVTDGGLKTFSSKINGKNASATGYRISASLVRIY